MSAPDPFSDGGAIFERIGEHPDGKVGFVVFRTYYGDDRRWEKFVRYLTNSTLHAISMDAGIEGMMSGRDKLLKDVFAYDIRDDKSTLDGASVGEVRRIFGQWAQSVAGDSTMPKYRLCIMVDKEVLDSVYSRDDDGSCQYVKLINGEHVERRPESDEDEWEAIDGCTAWDLGWMRQSFRDLFPSAYRVLMNWSWEVEYCRPPEVRED